MFLVETVTVPCGFDQEFSRRSQNKHKINTKNHRILTFWLILKNLHCWDKFKLGKKQIKQMINGW